MKLCYQGKKKSDSDAFYPITESERALSEIREQMQANVLRERTRIVEETKGTIEALREEQTARVTELRHDYRAEVLTFKPY